MTSQCPACDTEVAAGARFCPRCGADQQATVIEIGAEAQPAHAPAAVPGGMSRATKLGIAGVAAALIVVFVALMVTAGDEQPAPDEALPAPLPTPPATATPEPTVAAAATASDEPSSSLTRLDALEWTEGPTLGAVAPLALGMIGSETLLVTSPDQDLVFGEAGGSPTVEIWRSVDLFTWETSAVTIPDAQAITAATVTESGLLVAGRDPGGAVRVWRSPDGRTWTPSPPLDVDFDAPAVVSGIASSAETTIVSVLPGGPDIEGALRERLGGLPDVVEVDIFGPPLRVTARVPPGIAVASFTADDLGLDPSTAQQFFSFGTARHAIWALTDGDWTRAAVDPVFVTSLEATAQGFVSAFSTTAGGAGAWTSTDGVTWRLSEPGAIQVQAAGDRLLTSTPGVTAELTLDGEPWPIGELIGRQSFIGDIGLSESLAAVVTFQDTTRADNDDQRETVILIKDGVRVVRESGTSHIQVEDDETSYRLLLFAGDRPSDNVAADFDAETITFTRPSGTGSVTFSFDDLAELEMDDPLTGPLSVMVVSRDPGTAHVTPMVDVVGSRAGVFAVEAVGDAVVALAAVQDPDRPRVFTLAMWIALVPDRDLDEPTETVEPQPSN